MKKFILIVSILIFISGCAEFRSDIRKGAVDLSFEYIENRNAAVKIAKNLNTTWPMRSGIIKGYLFNDMKKLPVGIAEAMAKLDQFAKQKKPLTDEEYGMILGLRANILSETMIEIFRQMDIPIMEIMSVTLGD